MSSSSRWAAVAALCMCAGCSESDANEGTSGSGGAGVDRGGSAGASSGAGAVASGGAGAASGGGSGAASVGGSAGNLQAGGAAAGGSAAGSPTTGGAASGGGASGGSAGGGAGAEITLALFNVVTARVEPGFETVGKSLERVELPPRFTLEAKVTGAVKAVRFTIDNVERLDAAAPFRAHEATSGEASAWIAALGKHSINVAAFTDAAGQGAPLATLTSELSLGSTGTDTTFKTTDTATNDQWIAAHLDEVMVAKTFSGSVGTLPYRLFTPAKYDAAVAYPLLVYLHGRGDRGTDNRASIYQSKLFHGPQSIVSPNAQAQFPSFVLVPQCSNVPDAQEWAHWVGNLGQQDGSYQQAPEAWASTTLVKELIESLQKSQHIEKNRTYLTGESMGGFGTWELTTRWPTLFASGVPMAGYSDRSKVSAILGIPFWVFHGDADESNPVAGSRAMVKAITDAGGSAKYTEYAGLKHVPTFERAWTQETELLPWIYSQRRKP